MKKRNHIILVLLMVLIISGCGSNKEKEVRVVEPDVSQMKAICELATIECYYHNVAKYMKEDAVGALWWKKDRHFWIEYSGVVKIGVDLSLVSIEVKDTDVVITLPRAKVLSSRVDEETLTEKSFIIDEESAPVRAEDQTQAYREAQQNMIEAASNDTTLLSGAEQRVQTLLSDYIKNIGDVVGKEYSVHYNFIKGHTEKSSEQQKEPLDSESKEIE